MLRNLGRLCRPTYLDLRMLRPTGVPFGQRVGARPVGRRTPTVQCFDIPRVGRRCPVIAQPQHGQPGFPMALRAQLSEVGALGLLTPREHVGCEAPLRVIPTRYEGFARFDRIIESTLGFRKATGLRS
jgi:hypothetical protein